MPSPTRLVHSTTLALSAKFPPSTATVATSPRRPLLRPASIAGQRMSARLQGADGERSQPDFLDLFIAIIKASASIFVTPDMIFTYLMSNLTAGTDTIAATLCALAYHLLRSPHTLKTLQSELDAAPPLAPMTPVTWKQTQHLPYLDACMQEALRMTPGVGVALKRIVPAPALTLPCGRHIAAGTTVGMNAWVVHLGEEVFGSCRNAGCTQRGKRRGF
ncbi:hypothetical protein MMC08_006263 [Hypocenomyce scalaris]|nr:hypothetical protein [Hypocenomyce scalaris]